MSGLAGATSDAVCRLYGFRANEPTKVECTLVLAQNALLAQSLADKTGRSHPDGWGIACYTDGKPSVAKRESAAWSDIHFSTTAERIYASTVIAHVRRATVGAPSLQNTHPFTWGSWTFAHNGTVTAFDRLRPRLEQTEDRFLRNRRGTTDSELVFAWLLGRMARAGLEPDGPTPPVDRLAAVMAKTVSTLDRLCRDVDESEPTKLNLVLTDGHVLVATRWGRTLSWVQREGLHDCEVCGIPHVHHEGDYRAVVVASEELSDEPWQQVPDGALIAVDAEARAEVVAI